MVKRMRFWACCLLLPLLAGPAFSQESQVFAEAQEEYKQAVTFFEKGLYPQAQRAYRKVIRKLAPLPEPKPQTLLTKAELGYAQCAIRLKQPDGEILALDFIRKHAPDPIADLALVEAANYYFNARNYKQATAFYERAPLNSLGRKQRAQVQFRLGYCYFVQKQFDKAKANFLTVKDIENQYFYPANYYLGLCYFFEGEYDPALTQFRTVENSDKYEGYVPFYAAQILFAQRRFQDLIDYVKPRLDLGRGLKNKAELNQMLGQSYFELGQYREALPYLEEYAQRSSRMREEEFYQVAYTQYKTGNYQRAIQNFDQLSTVEDELSQHAMFYLADCFLKTGDKTSAWRAMGKAASMEFDPRITEDARFNYAKLSYELKAYSEAINILRALSPSSPYYAEGKALLSDILLNYRDYEQALQLLATIPEKSPELQATEQKVLLYRGMQLLRTGDRIQAKTFFQRAQTLPYDQMVKTQATYWLGEVTFQEEDYRQSIQYLNQFRQAAPNHRDLPEESSVLTASYLLGYNYLKMKDYASASRFFQEAVRGIQANMRFLDSEQIKRNMLGDALLRTGDTYFKQNRYDQAVQYYNQAIDQRHSGYVYAIYQKALIEGLRQKVTEKIIALERVANDYPNSEWADNALFELGSTYQEINRLQQAIPPLEKLVANYKTSSNLINQALIKLGLISYNLNNTQRAINYYKQVMANNPTEGEAQLALAALQEIYIRDLGQPDEYLAFLQSVPGYDMNNLSRDSVTYRAAEIQFENGNYERAVQAMSNYTQQFPNGRYRLQANYYRGESNSVLGNYSEALQDYEQVVNIGPSPYYQKALTKAAIIAYNHDQDFPKSLRLYSMLEESVQSADQKFEAQLGALRSAYRVGDPNAVRTWASKVAQNPNATPQQAANAQFYLGKLAYDQNDLVTALNHFQEVVAKSDNEQTAEARYLIAEIHFRQGDLDRARELCINANRESSAYPYWVAKSVLLLSDIFARQGDLFNARAALEALLENYQGDQMLIQQANSKLEVINQQIEQESRLEKANPEEFMENSGEGGQ